jgi:hypothetical protein
MMLALAVIHNKCQVDLHQVKPTLIEKLYRLLLTQHFSGCLMVHFQYYGRQVVLLVLTGSQKLVLPSTCAVERCRLFSIGDMIDTYS